MSTRVLSSPGKFIVGDGELYRLFGYIKQFGQTAFLIAHPEDSNRVLEALQTAEQEGVSLTIAAFGGECCEEEILRLEQLALAAKAEVVIGLGGGKAIDTAKCIADTTALPLIVVPTIASTDAPCSTLAVVYTPDHAFVECRFFKENPNIVLVDSHIIAKAPPRFLSAGMADAYATYFEARSCIKSHAPNYVGGVATCTAFSMAELCRDILLRDGSMALDACRKNKVTPELENIIEANLYLSGMGFESVGLAAAHAIHDALTQLPQTHGAMHGEKVAIGVLVQHILEHESSEQLSQTRDFFRSINLPLSLADIGLNCPTKEQLMIVANFAVSPGTPMDNMPFKVTAEQVFSALQMLCHNQA